MPARKRKRDPKWFVETILKAQRTNSPAPPGKFLHNPAWRYLIKWAEYSDDNNTWEPVSSLSECEPLLLKFWEHVGPESFLINAPGFEVEPTEEWISTQKQDFWANVSHEEVQAQIQNPKRRRSSSPERNSKRTPSSSPATPSTPRPSGSGSPRKVSFARDTQERIIPSLDEVEYTAQFHSSSHQPTAGGPSDSEDEDAIPDISPTTENTEPGPSPKVPPKTPLPSFFSPPSSPHQGIKIYDVPVTAGSTLATKSRLATASVAPGIPRATPAPEEPAQQTAEAAPADDVMNVDATPTLVPGDTLEAAGDEGPMLTSTLIDEDAASAGMNSFYEPGEDHYAGLRNNDGLLKNQNYAYEDVQDNWFDADEANPVSSDATIDFLNTIELPTLVNHGPDHRPSRRICEPAPMTKWAWNGQLSVTVNDQSEAVCLKCFITDSTECLPPRISAFVPSKQPLKIEASYDIEDILMYIDGCKLPHQFARLLADGPDGEKLEIFSQYLARKSQAFLAPAMWDEEVLGVLLFVSPTSNRLLEHLRTPPEVRDTGLVVILLLASDPPPKYKKDLRKLKRWVEPALMTPKQWQKSLRDERDYHISLRITQLSKPIRDYVYTHPSTVWPSPDDGRLDQDTTHLLRVLKKSRVGVVPLADTSADIVFIHVGAFKCVHELPHLVQRRLRPEVRFCLYGTDETVPPSLWGFREIYLLGGVVTFTPEALVDDAWSVLKTIRRIYAHPLWTCYLTPKVVGMAVKLIQLREDEMPEYTDAFPFTFSAIVNAIRQGDISLMNTPLDNLVPGDEDHQEWVLTNSVFRPQTTAAILEHCTKAFDAAYGSSQQDLWSTLAKNDLIADVCRMQIHSGACTDYRRFVILDSNSQANSDGIEWNTVGTFDFGDDFMAALEKLSIV
ncbi:hypothetical protein C8R45DRAFT_135850 [Mycena sanguinolenta]|nr:hypothetical protein C8R45DRAFT_135850 [Mycena sanguinolenta]